MLSGSRKALLENNFSESELEFTSVRTTINVDDTLLEMARALTGVTGTTALVRQALETLVRLETGKRLIALGGTMPDAGSTPRRRAEKRKAKSSAS
jgi:Arc/MetJ family transcription regulator